jgi:ribosomal protein S6--L-glutamate ligase
VKIVILSRQAALYSTRRLVEAVQSHGHQVKVLDPLRCLVEINGRQLASSTPAAAAVIPRIGASITEFGCAVVRRFEQGGIWALNPAAGIARSRDKLLSMQLLSGRGIPMPRTAVVGRPQGLERAIEAVGGLPAVMKLRRGTQGRGVVLVRSLAAARRAHSVLNDYQHYTLVQEFVAEACNRDIRVIVVGREAVAAMERQAAPGDFRANLHRGGSARPFRLNEGMKRLAVKAAEVHEVGFAGVDLLMSSRGPAVIEVNSSPGLQGIETTTGVDVAGAVITFVEEQCGDPTRFEDQEADQVAAAPGVLTKVT